jgi:ferric-dicitrate binding protein FerR (iron transport regulator)
MLSDRLLFLMTRQFAGMLTPDETVQLEELLRDPEQREAYEVLKKFWHQKERVETPDVERALSHVLRNINVDEPAPVVAPKRFRWMPVAVAASALVAVIAVILTFSKPHVPTAVATAPIALNDSNLVEKQNAKATRSIITLADGSKVWLNADSRLQYPAAFGATTREVALDGEAFFDVAKDKTKPFIIHLQQGTVRVLGTSFNIKAFKTDAAVETSVATGRVAFIPAAAARRHDTTFLTKNEKAIYDIRSGTVQMVATTAAVDKAWTEGKLIFNGTGMDAIATTLERNFAKEVVINDEELRSYHLTGSFENNSVEEILYYLSKTKPFTYRITETQIILSAVR